MSRRRIDGNPYGFVSNREAEDIASDALNNVRVGTDAVGDVFSGSRVENTSLIHNDSAHTAKDTAKAGKDAENFTEGNDRAAHETHTLKDAAPVHADESLQRGR